MQNPIINLKVLSEAIIKCTICYVHSDRIIYLNINRSYSNINDIKNIISRFKEINNKNVTIDDSLNENNFVVKVPLSSDETSENCLDQIVSFLLYFNVFRASEIKEINNRFY